MNRKEVQYLETILDHIIKWYSSLHVYTHYSIISAVCSYETSDINWRIQNQFQCLILQCWRIRSLFLIRLFVSYKFCRVGNDWRWCSILVGLVTGTISRSQFWFTVQWIDALWPTVGYLAIYLSRGCKSVCHWKLLFTSNNVRSFVTVTASRFMCTDKNLQTYSMTMAIIV